MSSSFELAVRQLDYWATVYRRTWKGTVVSSFVNPLLYVMAMGVLLGGFIAGDPARLEGAPTYLAFIAPGLLAAQSMQTAVGETTYPVMSMVKWQKVYFGMQATPLRPVDLVNAHLGFIVFRLALTSAVFAAVLAPFDVYHSLLGAVGAWLVAVLVGVAIGLPVYAFSAGAPDESSFALVFRLGVIPQFLFSGAFFPIANLGEVGAWAARLTPLLHGVNLSRMFCLDNVDWPVAAINVTVLLAMTAFGWWWSVTGLTKRLMK